MKTVKINQKISDFSEPEEGEIYQIIHVDTKVQKGFNGVNIEFVPKKVTEENKKTQYRVTAWLGQNDTVGTRSKLGAFISAFQITLKLKWKTIQTRLQLKHKIQINGKVIS